MTRKRKRESDAFEEEAGLPEPEAEAEVEVEIPNGEVASTSRDAFTPLSHTVSASPSRPTSRPPSPVNRIILDDDEGTSRTQSDDSRHTKEEKEVEDLLAMNGLVSMQRSCSISEQPSTSKVDPDVDMEGMTLTYPESEDVEMNAVADLDVTPEPVSDVSGQYNFRSLKADLYRLVGFSAV